jgi:co-chaperonin GroES (HSP10)
MSLSIEENDLSKLIVIGDRVLIKPKNPQTKTRTGLFLPPSVQESEQILSGYIVKTGPGYAVGTNDPDESWKGRQEVQYIPLQTREGDLAVFLQSAAHEIRFNDETYLIVPHKAILLVVRDEALFD